MSKQAFSIAEDETQEGRGLVPAGGAPEEMPAHAKARPIPRISIQAFCEDAATAAVAAGGNRRPPARQDATSACTWAALPRPLPTITKAPRRT